MKKVLPTNLINVYNFKAHTNVVIIRFAKFTKPVLCLPVQIIILLTNTLTVNQFNRSRRHATNAGLAKVVFIQYMYGIWFTSQALWLRYYCSPIDTSAAAEEVIQDFYYLPHLPCKQSTSTCLSHVEVQKGLQQTVVVLFVPRNSTRTGWFCQRKKNKRTNSHTTSNYREVSGIS